MFNIVMPYVSWHWNKPMIRWIWFFIMPMAFFAQGGGVRSLELGLGMSAIGYSGDLSNGYEAWTRFGSGFSISAQFVSYKVVRPQISITAGSVPIERSNDLSSDSLGKIVPADFMQTRTLMIDLRIMAYPFPSAKIQPFLGPGIGILSFDPRDANGNSLADQSDTRPSGESYSNIALQFPMTAGCRWNLSKYVALQASYTHHLVMNDFLDNTAMMGTVSGNDLLRSVRLGVHIAFLPDRKFLRTRRG